MNKPLHIDKQELFCNRCNRNIDKFIGTLTERINPDEYGEVYCLVCHNWLCGEYDAFGELGRFGYCNNNKNVILKLKSADKVLHDAKIILSNVAKACENFRKFSQDFETEIKNIMEKAGEIQDLINEALEHLEI